MYASAELRLSHFVFTYIFDQSQVLSAIVGFFFLVVGLVLAGVYSRSLSAEIGDCPRFF